MAVEIDVASELRYRDPVYPDRRRGAVRLAVGRDRRHPGGAARRQGQGPDHHRGGECGRNRPSRAKPTSCCRPMRGRKSASPRPRPSPASWRRWPRSPSRRARRAASDAARTRSELGAALLEAPRHIAEFLKQEAADRGAGARKSPRRATCSIWAAAPAIPLALEGALKLKEISYIHAEGYAAGEMKHGPIALIDENVPIIVIAPHDAHFEKTISNMQEVMARGGKVLLISDARRAPRRARSGPRSRCPTPTPSSRRCSMPFRCSCWPIMPPSPRAPTWISRAIWRNRSRSSSPKAQSAVTLALQKPARMA